MSGFLHNNNNSRPVVVGYGNSGNSTLNFNNQGNNLTSSQCNLNALNNRQDNNQNRNSLDQ